MDPILEFARQHGLAVIEDAAQAHGATYRGLPVGSIGDAGCFSFYPGKNLGAFGEAGAIVTQSEQLADIVRVLRDHGQVRKYQHTRIGWNCRMDGIQAAVLRVKLPYLARGNHLRRERALQYGRAFADVGEIITPFAAPYVEHVYHLYAIRVRDRSRVCRFLSNRRIDSGIHYPVPIHLQEAYQHLGYGPGSFPVTERVAEELLSLPMFPELTPHQVDAVVGCVRESIANEVVS